jgi:hypothetical protein
MNASKERMKLRAWLAVVLFILGLVLLALASLPETRLQQVMPFPPITLPSPTPISMLGTWGGI